MKPFRTLRPLRWAWLWSALWVAMVALVVIGSLLPAGDLPEPAFDGVDKLQHLLGYAILSAYAVMLFSTRRAMTGAAVALVALGVMIEIAQHLLTDSRQADAVDVFANTAGVGLGQLVAFTPVARLLERIDGGKRA